MAEKETLFSSKIKYTGVFSFQDFYQFCYDWLIEEFELLVIEDKYIEKIEGDSKKVDIEWTGVKKVTDYFRYAVKVKFKIIGLKKVEVQRDGVKEKMNEGVIEVKVSSTLIRDWQGKFESNGFQKFLRTIYDKWVIPSRIDQVEGKLIGDSNEFLEQAKAYLDMSGKR